MSHVWRVGNKKRCRSGRSVARIEEVAFDDPEARLPPQLARNRSEARIKFNTQGILNRMSALYRVEQS
ncbi:hypothetical protein SUDANB95_07112 [Actinosynnema sp. ALI-1.44]